jgi:outer membrane protein assembly factor BamB
MRSFPWAVLPVIALSATAAPLTAADWPQWGRDFTHNAVSPEKGLPEFQFPEIDDKGKVLKPARGLAWTADLGSRTVVHPVVADGLVWVCTNAREPADETIPAKEWDGGVLLCLREADGKVLWRHRTPRLNRDAVNDWARTALGSAPLIEGDRLWFTNNRSEVVCLDIGPLKNGTGDPKEVWKLSLIDKLGVYPHIPLMQSGFAASVAGYKDWLYVVTHNGVDESHIKLPAPDAPSLVCLEKKSGKVVWQDKSPGKGIMHIQISSPLAAEVNGKPQVIVGQGDGWLRSFEAATGNLIWKCDLNPKAAKPYELGGRSVRNYVVATPVLWENRVYIAPGQQNEHGDGPGCLYCIDPSKTGDVSRELDDGPQKGKPNPNSAVAWHTLGPFPDGVPNHNHKKKILDLRDGYLFGRTISSCTVHDGLVYAGDLAGFFFCFDAKTGKPYWIHDLRAYVYDQPLWVDGKVLVANEDGEVFVFAHGKEKKLLAKLESEQPIRPGLVLANGTLYVTSEHTLYAFRNKK